MPSEISTMPHIAQHVAIFQCVQCKPICRRSWAQFMLSDENLFPDSWAKLTNTFLCGTSFRLNRAEWTKAAWMTNLCAFVFVWFGNLTLEAASCATSTKLQKACNVCFVLSPAFIYPFVISRITEFTGFESRISSSSATSRARTSTT